MDGPDGTSEVLPPLYSGWIAELLQAAIPRETRATCDDCAMWPRGGEQQGRRADYFDSVIKCCTYVPDLHNFLVGRILTDDDPNAATGRATVEKRIGEGVAVTPLGLAHPPLFSLLYENNTGNAFGRSRALKCPHYIEDGGRCGVWRHRESTCATWFCKHLRGGVGYAFWRESLHQLLLQVERALARWAVLELDIDDDVLRHLVGTAAWRHELEPVTGEAIDNRVDPDTYRKVWGKWLGREGKFFIECAALVNRLSWAEVLAISGQEARAYARLTQEQYRILTSDEIPPALKVGSVQLVQISRGASRVSAYSAFDPIEIPSIVMDSLHYFDGRPTREAVEAIAREKEVRLEPSLVRKMADFGVLIQVEQPASSPMMLPTAPRDD
jgi:hypothetical protein